MFRVCSKCNIELPATLEYFHSAGNKGILKLRKDCIKCRAKESKRYYELNAEVLRQKTRAYNKEHYKK